MLHQSRAVQSKSEQSRSEQSTPTTPPHHPGDGGELRSPLDDAGVEREGGGSAVGAGERGGVADGLAVHHLGVIGDHARGVPADREQDAQRERER
jgi:hypothetical protein